MKKEYRPVVSVVVVNYNRLDLLKSCLESLSVQLFRDFEVIVVDNGSRDGSVRLIRTEIGKLVDKAVFLDENTGFTGGCNRGIEEASGLYVALINNDAEADPHWLSELVKAASENPSVGMLASKIVFVGTGLVDKAGHLMFPDGQNRGRGTGERDCGQYQIEEEALFPDGCAAFYRRDLLAETGGFDEDFFAYADDADLGLRARWLGWSCLYIPQALVYHRHSSTTGSFDPEKIYWVERNRIWLALKNLPFILLLASPAFTAYRFAWNAAAAVTGRGSAGSFRRAHSSFTLASVLFRATWDGWMGLPVQLRKRKEIKRSKKIGNYEFIKLLLRFRISARRLTWQ